MNILYQFVERFVVTAVWEGNLKTAQENQEIRANNNKAGRISWKKTTVTRKLRFSLLCDFAVSSRGHYL